MNENFERPKFWNVIINPMALRGGSITYWHSISRQLVLTGLSFKESFTTSKNDALHLSKDLVLNGATAILVVGGDGTLNEVVNGIMSCENRTDDIILAVLPAGTGNDWSRTHCFSGNKKDILSMFTSGKVVCHDIGVVKTKNRPEILPRYFINIAGFGFDAAVVERTHRAHKYKVAKGMVYIKHLILTLLNYQSIDCELLFDNVTENKHVFSIAAGICKYNGNGMLPVPMADPTDGLIDVIVIEEMSVWKIVKQIPSLFKGTHIHHPKVSHHRVTHFEIISNEPIQCEVEGEMVGDGNYVINVSPRRLKMLIPSI